MKKSQIAPEFYKGFILTKNKKPIEKISDPKNWKPFQSVKLLPEFAGVIASDAILVDVDDMEQSELLLNIVEHFDLKCRVQRSRSGMHFLFKNKEVEHCPNAINLAIGIKADIKSGFKNCYEVLKIDGVEREVLYDKFPEEEYEVIPKWLFPVRSPMQFLDMDEGDGRNQALFSYILTLQANGFTMSEARKTIEIINEFILKKPLPESELKVILRDEAFQKPIFFEKGKFLLEKFTVFLKNTYHIKRINGQLHLFKDGIYIPGQEKIESAMIHHVSDLRASNRSEVWKYLNLVIQDNTPMAAPNYIAFRNGIYDLITGDLKPFSPDIVITNQIPWDYNPNAYSELADRTLDKISCDDSQVRQILEECIGSCFYRSNHIGGSKAFILTGEGANGKSTFIDMLQHLLSEENIASLDLKELDMKFQNAALFGRLANLGDDISDEFIVNVSIFKKFVTGDRVQVQNKGEKPFEFNNYAKFLFSANNIPRIKDKTGAVLRRLLIVPFDAKFSNTDEDYDPDIRQKLQNQEVMEYLIIIGLNALKAVIENKRFTESVKVAEELKEYEEFNNPIIGFFEECEADGFQIENEPTNDVYGKYQGYCINNGFNKMSKAEFSKQIKKKYGFVTKSRTINGKSIRIYFKE